MLEKLRQNWQRMPAHRRFLLFFVIAIGIAVTLTSIIVMVPAYRGERVVPAYALAVPLLLMILLAAWIVDALSHIAFKDAIPHTECLVHDMILYGANIPSWLSYVLSMWWGNVLFPFSVTFVLLKIGYACYDEFRFHWVRARRSEIIMHYLLFLSIAALDIIWLRWAYADHWIGLFALF